MTQPKPQSSASRASRAPEHYLEPPLATSRSPDSEAFRQRALGTAHDVNNMLACIMAEAGQLEAMLARLPNTHPHLQQIQDATERAALLLRELMQLDGVRGAPAAVELNEVVRASTEMLGSVLLDHGIELRCAFAGELPPVAIAAGKLDQVLVNLVLNACQSMSQGGTVRVATRLADERERALLPPGDGDGRAALVVEISDDGVGMEDTTCLRAFEPRFTTRDGGQGLGLARSRHSVREAGGIIDMHSHPGVGSTFVVVLPAPALRQRMVS